MRSQHTFFHTPLDAARRSPWHPRPARSGQGLIEFALSIILLMTIFCAIFEFSWVLYNYAYLNNAISKSLRDGLVQQGETQATVSTVIKKALTGVPGGLPITFTTFTITSGATTVTTVDSGDVITIGAKINYTSLTPLSSLVQMTTFNTLSANAQGRVE
jgi:Flp pilus assembly protein TadG